MRKSLIKGFCLFVSVLYVSLTVISCSSPKKVKYFQDIPDSGLTKTIPKADYTAPQIRVGDILYIQIQTIDPLAAAPVNAGNTPGGSVFGASGASGLLASVYGGTNASQQQPALGFLVDKEGYIEIPVIGKIIAAGSTTFQLKEIVYNLALKYYKNPTVIVRISNFKVSVIGEVLKPGQYILTDEKEGILDAIAMAGDLTVFGKRENVLLIRDNLDGTKTTYRINLKKSDMLSSPEYYLRQNDIIYVEPRKAKSDATDAAQQKYVTIAAALLSIILVLAYRVK